VEAELKSSFPDSKIKVVVGSGGIFDVKCDGKLVYSKAKTNRFPQEGEVTKLIGEK
jgi:selT/selW/selH-like putative selenoprotein